MAKRVLVALTAAPVALLGCHSSEEDLPTSPPSTVTKVSSGGFTSPTDAVASLDGKTFYFGAYDDQREPATFEVASEPGSVAAPLAVASR